MVEDQLDIIDRIGLIGASRRAAMLRMLKISKSKFSSGNLRQLLDWLERPIRLQNREIDAIRPLIFRRAEGERHSPEIERRAGDGVDERLARRLAFDALQRLDREP